MSMNPATPNGLKPVLPRKSNRNGAAALASLPATNGANGTNGAHGTRPASKAKAPRAPKQANSDVHGLQAQLEAFQRGQAVAEFDLHGTLLSANPTFLKLTGYLPEEVQGRSHDFLCDSSEVQSTEYRALWANLARGETQVGEYRRNGKGGREIWLAGSYSPVLGEDGDPEKVLFAALDITATRTELKVRMDIMNLTSIVSEADLKGDILSINEKFIQVSKYGREELIGRPHNTTRHPDMPKEVFREMWSTIGRGNVFRGVVKNRAKDGTPYYVDAVIAPILGDNGKPKKYLGVRYDITEAELERHNMRGIFRAIDSTYAYIEFDTEGNVLSANQNFQDVMEYTAEAIKGKHHRIFCDQAAVASPEYQQFWPDLRSGKSKSGEFKRSRAPAGKSGSKRYMPPSWTRWAEW